MYLQALSGMSGDEEVWGASVGEQLPTGWDTIPAAMPTASGKANDYAPYFNLASQAISVWGSVRNTETNASVSRTLAARGIVPAGYGSSPAAAVRYGQTPAVFSPFPATGATAGTFNPLLILLTGAALAAWIALK